MLINIFDKGIFFQTSNCRTTVLQDGRAAAMFQGWAYPLLPPGETIDIGGEAFSPGVIPNPRQATTGNTAFAVIEGEEEAYVLIDGTSLILDRVVKGLRQNAITVLRSGRYFGDTVDGLLPDWFIRIIKPAAFDGALSLHLKALLGFQNAQPRQGAENAAQLRIRLLIGELEASRSREVQARSEIERLRHRLAAITLATNLVREIASNQDDRADLEAANVDVVQTEIEEAAETAPHSGASLTEGWTAAAVPRPLARVIDEVALVFDTLLPRIQLLKDSLTVMVTEFSDRRALYRALHGVGGETFHLSNTSKKLKGRDDWWERHVSTGQDNSGRIYARIDRNSQIWSVLVSKKGSQDRDIAWLDHK